MKYAVTILAVGLAAASRVAGAQGDTSRVPAAAPAATSPTIGPPVRRISTAAAVSKEPIGAITSVRELPDGRVLLNDGMSRRLLILDTMMTTERVVLDSASEKENTYGVRQGTLIPHRGDSTLFIDPASLALLVIDPNGDVVRVRSVPRAQEAFAFTGGFGATQVTTDTKGRLVYRINPRPEPPKVAPPKGVPWFPSPPDSALIVALDLDTRSMDTLGVIRTPKVDFIVKMNPNGNISSVNTRINPLPIIDEWAVMPDGSVAFVRGRDYRVEFRSPEGEWTSTPKIPYDWQPFPDSLKKHYVDSIETTGRRNAWNTYVTSMIRWVNTYHRRYPPNFAAPDGYRPPNGFGKEWTMPANVTFPARYIYACAPGEEPAMTPPAGAEKAAVEGARGSAVTANEQPISVQIVGGVPVISGGGQGMGAGTPSCIPQPIPNLSRIPDPPTLREVNVVAATNLPDFKPPFDASAVRADLDGNLWIRINTPRPDRGGPIYDVVNREGRIIDRLQVPVGYTLVGFGRGKVVFVAMRDASGAHLARVRMK